MRHPWVLLALAVVLAPVGFADEGHDHDQGMPGPGPEHERLYFFLGEWEGEEVFAKSDWMPEGAESVGRYVFRSILDGMYVEYDYETEGSNHFEFEGKGVYGYDAMKGAYHMSWFDLMGGAEHALGKWTDEGLVFEYETQWGETKMTSRSVVKVLGDHEFSFVMGHIGPDGQFREFMHGTYERIGGRKPEMGAAGARGLMPCCRMAIEKLAAAGSTVECCGHPLDGKVEMHACCKKKLAEALGDEMSACCLKALQAKSDADVPPCCKAAQAGDEMPACCEGKK